MAAANVSRGAFPLVAICCLGLILFAIAATIVLALIPVYLKTRDGPAGKLNAAGGHALTKPLAAGPLNKIEVIAAAPPATRRRRRQIFDKPSSSPPLAANQR